MKLWTRGVMREAFGGFDQAEEVLVIETAIKHTDLSLGKTYFVMSRHHLKVIHLSEAVAGKNLSQLVRLGETVPKDKQSICTKRCKQLLASSVYHPRRRATHTNFFQPKRKGR